MEEPGEDVVLTTIEEIPEEKPSGPKIERSPIPVSQESMGLAPTDHGQLGRFIDQMVKAKSIPKHLMNAHQVMCAWNYAAQLRLPPQPSIRHIAVIDGSPQLFGDLPLSLVQRHPDFIFNEEFCFDEKYEKICFENKNLHVPIFGGLVKFQRKGMKEPQSFAFTKIDAERAGLIVRAKPGMPWHTYPQVMYIRRARIIGIRSLFADAITGAAIAEDFGYAPDIVDVSPTSGGIADELNREYLTPKTEGGSESTVGNTGQEMPGVQ